MEMIPQKLLPIGIFNQEIQESLKAGTVEMRWTQKNKLEERAKSLGSNHRALERIRDKEQHDLREQSGRRVHSRDIG